MQNIVKTRAGALALGAAVTLAVTTMASGQVIQERFTLVGDVNPSAVGTNQRIGFIGTLGNEVFVGIAENAQTSAAIYKATSTGATDITGFSVLSNNFEFLSSGLDTSGLEARNVGTATVDGVEQFLIASPLGTSVSGRDIVSLNPTTGNLVQRLDDPGSIRSQTVANNTLYWVDTGADTVRFYEGPTGNTGTLFSTLDNGMNLVDGLAVAGNFLYLADDTSDTIYRADLSNATPASTITAVLNATAISSVAGGFNGDTTAGFESMILGGDGRIYFYEDRSDSVLGFDPADPTGTLGVVASSALLTSGIGTDNLQGLVWFEDALHVWTSAQGNNAGLYAIVPEPTSLAGLTLAAAGLLRRRR